jgi:transcriptional regulator with XRE-family HTH domain
MATGGYGRLIQAARDKKGLSQSRLAEKVYVNARTVSRWETERTRPSGESLKLLAMVLEIPLEDLEAAVAAAFEGSSKPDTQDPPPAGASGDGAEPAQSSQQAPSPLPSTSAELKRQRFQRARVVAGVAVVGALAVFLFRPWLEREGENPAATGNPTESPVPFSSPTGTAIPAGAVASAVLGRDIQPESATPCGTQGAPSGAEWVFGPATVEGIPYAAAYRCLMFAGASGELVFRLDGKYSRVHLVAGFLTGSRRGQYPVRFALLRDGKFTPMTPFELELGESSELDYSVEGVSRLSIRVTGTGPPGADESPSTPVVASLLLF